MVRGYDHILLSAVEGGYIRLLEDIFKSLRRLFFHGGKLFEREALRLLGEHHIDHVALGYLVGDESRRPQMVDAGGFWTVVLLVDEVFKPEGLQRPGAGRGRAAAGVSPALYADAVRVVGGYAEFGLTRFRAYSVAQPVGEERAQIKADLIRSCQKLILYYRAFFSMRHKNRFFEEDTMNYKKYTWEWISLIFL